MSAVTDEMVEAGKREAYVYPGGAVDVVSIYRAMLAVAASRQTVAEAAPVDPEDAKMVECVAMAICEASAEWIKDPLHFMAYQDMARAALTALAKKATAE